MHLSAKVALLPLVTSSLAGIISTRDIDTQKLVCRTYTPKPNHVWSDKTELKTEDQQRKKKRDIENVWREADKIIDNHHYYWSASINGDRRLDLTSRGFGKLATDQSIFINSGKLKLLS
jgi:hypothetical protein